VSLLDADGSATLVFPDLTRRRWAERLTPEFQGGACHAGRYETSILLAETPGLVDAGLLPTLPPNPRSLTDAIRRGQRTFEEAGGPQAYFGWPADATAEEGRAIIDVLGAVVEESVRERLSDDARRPKNEERNAEHRTTNEEPERGVSVLEIVNPPALERPSGFSHGILAPPGWRTLHVAGQTAGPSGAFDTDFAGQFDRALARVLAVVRAAGSTPAHVTRMTIYVTDIEAYRESRSRLGDVWVRHMGRHYPAMALVEVRGLVEPGAVVEIDADAVLP
jgi:enamine deaminase RidA (YjgF/YER057c/UK114 family)